MMSDYAQRLFIEHSELKVKIDKLRAFIISDQYDLLPEVDRTDLKQQLKHMEGYFYVLSYRVSRQCS